MRSLSGLPKVGIVNHPHRSTVIAYERPPCGQHRSSLPDRHSSVAPTWNSSKQRSTRNPCARQTGVLHPSSARKDRLLASRASWCPAAIPTWPSPPSLVLPTLMRKPEPGGMRTTAADFLDYGYPRPGLDRSRAESMNSRSGWCRLTTIVIGFRLVAEILPKLLMGQFDDATSGVECALAELVPQRRFVKMLAVVVHVLVQLFSLHLFASLNAA
jgi:hypothetical protein